MSILRLAGKALAAAVDAVLADQRQRVGEQIERDRQPAARAAHHRFVVLERVAVLVEDRHSRLTSSAASTAAARRGSAGCAAGWRSRLTTTSATSSGAIFQSAPFDSSPPDEPGRHRARHHVADADVVVAHLLHQRLAERVQARLRRAVGGAAGNGVLAGQAADVDDVAAAALAQVRHRRVAGVEDAGQVGVDHLGPLRGRHVGDVGEDADAGVVDQDVEAAEPRDGGGDRALDLVVAAHVGPQRLDRAGPGALDLRPRRRTDAPRSCR